MESTASRPPTERLRIWSDGEHALPRGISGTSRPGPPTETRRNAISRFPPGVAQNERRSGRLRLSRPRSRLNLRMRTDGHVTAICRPASGGRAIGGMPTAHLRRNRQEDFAIDRVRWLWLSRDSIAFRQRCGTGRGCSLGGASAELLEDGACLQAVQAYHEDGLSRAGPVSGRGTLE